MRYDMKKRDPFYGTAAWQRIRRAALIRDHYLCQRCRKRPANTVHHIRPREDYPEDAMVLENLQSVCAICHNREHPEKGSRGGDADRGIPAGIRVIEIGGRRERDGGRSKAPGAFGAHSGGD